MQSFTFGTSALRLDETPSQAFFRMLSHDDRSSFYCVARRGADGHWSESFARVSQLLNYTLFDDADWYVTRNGFTQRSRKTERLRQINAFMFDLDCHEGHARSAVEKGIRALEQAVLARALPEPNMLVDTGRGLHVYYVLDHSLSYRVTGGAFNEKGLAFFRDVEGKLLAAVKSAVECVPTLEVDTAVFDFARVSRIPGTYNVSAGRYAQLIHYNDRYYSLSQLSSFGFLKPVAIERKSPGKTQFVNFDKLSLSRVGKLFKLQEVRQFNCKGNRELMCFCLYNAAVQIYADKEDAFARLVEFNKRFSEPLAVAVLDQIVRSVSKVGFYKMSAATIVSKLRMTSAEIDATSFFESRRMIERQQAKRATAEKREARNARIVALYAQPGATMETVAQAVGVCKRTVASVLKAAKETLEKNKTAVQATITDLKEAARATLNFFASSECNFLADDFCCVGPFSSGYSLAVGSVSVFLSTGT